MLQLTQHYKDLWTYINTGQKFFESIHRSITINIIFIKRQNRILDQTNTTSYL